MINPAQFNEVLGRASDQQLMALLKRPDKIPSQFVVSEINRRQAVRQAAQAQQRQQAIAQEQQRAAQSMNTQMRAPRMQNPNNMRQSMPQPVGMSNGGIPPVKSIGDFATFAEYKNYMDARAEAIRQQNAASDIAIADSGMTGIDTAPTYLSAAEEAALADSGMTEIDEGIKEPFFQFGGVNPGAVFSDGSPADIPKALAAGLKKVGSYKGTERNPSFPNAATINPRDTEGAFAAGLKKAASYKGVDRNPSIYELRAAQAEDAALNKSYAGIKNFDFGPMSNAPVGPQNIDASGVKKEPVGYPGTFEGVDFGNITIKDGKAEVKPTGDKQTDEAIRAAGDASIADAQNALKPDNNAGVRGDDANKNTGTNTGTTTDTSGIKSVSSIVENRDNNPLSIGDLAKTGVAAAQDAEVKVEPGVFKSESLLGIFNKQNENVEILNDAANAAKMKANDAQRERIESLGKTLNELHDTQSKLLELYDKTAMTPENRIFTAMIDAGIALAGSKEANFLQAVSEASKTGVESFNNLTDEAKKNLFDKYSASVDLAKSRVNIESQLNQAISAVEQSEAQVLSDMAQQKADSLARNIEVASKEGTLAQGEASTQIAAAGAKTNRMQAHIAGVNTLINGARADIETQLSAERNAISAATADNQVWVQMRELENADERLDLAAEELGIKREQLNVDRLYKYISTKLDERRIDVQEKVADKKPDSVAKLEWMLGHFGKDGLLKILGPSTTGAVTDDDIARMATSMATASSAAMDDIIGADGQVIKDPDMEDYVTYYTGMLKGIYQGGGGQTSGNTRVFNEDSGKVE